MIKLRLNPGDLWQVNEKIYAVKERIDYRVVFKNTGDESLCIFEDADFNALCLAGKAKPFRSEEHKERRNPVFLLTDEQSNAMDLKLAYVQMLKDAPRGQRTGPRFKERIAALARDLGDPKPPAPRTIRNWDDALKAASGDPSVLAPRLPGAPRSRRMPAETFEALVAYTNHVYLKRGAPSKEEFCRDFNEKEIPRLRIKNPVNADRYVELGKSTIRGFLDSLDPFLVMERQEGREAALKYFRTFNRGPRYERPLQCVQIDTWKQHLIYVDGKSNPLGRLYVTAVIDCYSRVVVGFYIGPEPPSAWTVSQAIRHAMLPKDYVRERYPEIRSEYPTFGRFEMACFDQGPENANLHISRVMGSLGAALDYGPKGQPWKRGIIERWFGTLARGLVHRLEGSTFSNVQERGDYDPVRNARFTAPEIIRQIHCWIADDYHNATHSELGDTPLNVWKKGVEKFGLIPPPSSDALSMLLCQRITRAINKYGIEFNNAYYNGPELGALKGQSK